MRTERDLEERSRSSFMLSVLGWVFGALALYVLSVGPMARIYKTGRAPALVDAAYKPLDALYRGVKPVRAFYDWYLPLWGVY